MNMGLEPSLGMVSGKLVMAVEHINASRYVAYSTFCLLVYDHALTFGDEIHLVWQSRSVNLVKIMFLCNRYLVPIFIAADIALLSGLVSGLTNETCRAWLIVVSVAEVISLFSTTYIITLRIRALWTDNREVNVLLQSVWMLHVVGGTALLINTLVKNQASYSVSILNVCTGSIVDAWTVWLPAMVFHFIIFLLLILKAVSTPRNAHTKLMTILLLDGFIYFAVVFGAFLANMLIYAIASPTLAHLPHDAAWAISTLAITRLLLSLQKRYHGEGENPQIVAQLAATGVPPPMPNPQYDYDHGTLSTRSNSHDRLARLRSMSAKGRPATPSSIHSTSKPFLVRLQGVLSSIGIHWRKNDTTRAGEARSSSLYSITAQPYYADLQLRTAPCSHRRKASAHELEQVSSFDPESYRRLGPLTETGDISPPPPPLPHPYVEAAIMAGVPVPSARMLHDLRATHAQVRETDVPRALQDPFSASYGTTSNNGPTLGSFRTTSRSNALQRTSTHSSSNHGHQAPTTANEFRSSGITGTAPVDREGDQLATNLPEPQAVMPQYARPSRVSKLLPPLPKPPPTSPSSPR